MQQDFLKEIGQLMQKYGIASLRGGTLQYDADNKRIVAKDVCIRKKYNQRISPESQKMIQALEKQNVDRLLEQALKNNDKILFDKIVDLKNTLD